MNDDFYIGWSDETPKDYKGKAKWFFAIALVVLVASAVLYVRYERGFIDSLYEFGTFREVSGVLVDQPAWGIKTVVDGAEKTILLVGFGKAGPDETLQGFIREGKLKVGQYVTLRGQVFHYQGRYGMELTEMEGSFVGAEPTDIVLPSGKSIGMRQLEGEIVDSKCFFGVMNPATKAIHRSCAVRCISGGIPPVLVIREEGKFVDYYILNSADKADLSKDILPYVGVPVKLSGRAMVYDDWKSLEISLQDVELAAQYSVPSRLTAGLTLCR